jgi:phosphate:Na+ symporter
VLAIGAAVGTTVKGALVAIGATVSAKRTALAHILFNTATGGIALLLLPGFLRALDWAQRRFGLDAGAQSLALFHTLFIAVGVLVFLPFTRRFARLIERLLPDRELRPTRHLDKSLLSVPAVALEAARRALCETARETIVLLQALLGGAKEGLDEARRARFAEVIDEIRDFLAQIPALISDEALSGLHLAQIHGVDHLLRLQSRLEPSPGVRLMFLNPHLAPAVQVAQDVLATAAAALASGPEGHCADHLDRLRSLAVNLAELRRSERVALLRKTAGGDWIDSEALDALDAGRWMDGVGYHVWRLCHYLASPDAPGAFPADAQELHPED